MTLLLVSLGTLVLGYIIGATRRSLIQDAIFEAQKAEIQRLRSRTEGLRGTVSFARGNLERLKGERRGPRPDIEDLERRIKAFL